MPVHDNFMHPDLAGKSVEEIAASVAAPGTPEHAHYLELLPRTLDPAYRDLNRRFTLARIEQYRTRGSKVAKVRCSDAALVDQALMDTAWRCTFHDYAIDEEHVRQAQAWYGPSWLITDDESRPGWPTSWWFRFAQTNWGKSRWHMVPDFSPAELALAGFDLVSTSRWMGDVTDEEKLEFAFLQRELEWHGKDGMRPGGQDRLNNGLLAQMPYGGELPILDVDVAKYGKRTPEEVEAVRVEWAERAAQVALAVTAVWRQVTGVTPRWTVTNGRGGLHGLCRPLPPHARHLDLLRALLDEMQKTLTALNVPFIVKGSQSESAGPVKLDLTAFNKYAAGHGGMWRVPLCAKPEGDSLPQVPVAQHVKSMPWLKAITPETLRSDWEWFAPASSSKVLGICQAHRKKIDEAEVKQGRAYVDGATGKIKRVRRASVAPDIDIGTAAFAEVAGVIRKIMPAGEHEGVKRHNVRLAIAGWFYREKVPKEAALSTLLASGGNEGDSRKVVDTTYARGAAGEGVAGAHRVVELLGQQAMEDLAGAFAFEREMREGQQEEEPEPPRDEEDVEATPSRAAPEPEKDEDDHEPPTPMSVDEAWDSGDGGTATSVSTASSPPDPTVVVTPPPASATPSTVTSVEKDTVSPPKAPPGKKKGFYFGDESIPKSLTHPFSSHHLSFVKARERYQRPEHHWNTDDPSGMLLSLKTWLHEAKARVPHGKYFWVTKVVGYVLAFAGVGKKTVSATSYQGTTRSESVLTNYNEAMIKLRTWKPGEELPPIPSLSVLRRLCGYKLWSGLIDAIQKDLKNAPFDVQERALVDQARSSEERDTIAWLVASIEESGETLNDPRFEKKEWQRIQDVIRCGRLANERICAGHGLVATIPIYCDSEVGCRHCRYRAHSTIADWVSIHWQHPKYVVFRWEAGTDPVRVEVRDGAHGDDPNFEEDKEASWLAPAREPGDREQGRNKRFVLKKNDKGEAVALIARAIRNKGRSEKGKYLGRVLSMDLLDRIKKGFRASRDFKVFQGTTENQLPFRAYPTPTGLLVIMIDTFNVEPEGGGMPEEQNTLRHLQLIDAFQRFKPRVVTKDEVLSELLRARLEVGEEFDRLTYELMRESQRPPDPPIPEGAERGRTPAEIAVLTYPFLRDRAMEAVRNDAALEHLPWYDGESLREFKKALRAQRNGPEEVKPNECPVPVVQPDGTIKPCRRILGVVLKDQRTGEIFADNSTGKHYAKKEAWKIAAERCHGFGVIVHSRHGPAPEACSHGELAHAHC